MQISQWQNPCSTKEYKQILKTWMENRTGNEDKKYSTKWENDKTKK